MLLSPSPLPLSITTIHLFIYVWLFTEEGILQRVIVSFWDLGVIQEAPVGTRKLIPILGCGSFECLLLVACWNKTFALHDSCGGLPCGGLLVAALEVIRFAPFGARKVCPRSERVQGSIAVSDFWLRVIDFLFFGECSNCSNSNGARADDQGHDDDDVNNDIVNDPLVIHTRLILDSNQAIWNDTAMNNQQHQLLLESLLRPISGVRKVVVNLGQVNCRRVTVHHDASCVVHDFWRVLQQGGYPACKEHNDEHSNDNNNNGNDEPNTTAAPCVVKSTFFVQGICCALEVPSIR